MGVDVSKCKYYDNGKCERYEDHIEADYNDYTVKCICEHENCFGDYDICDYLELQQLKAENEQFKATLDEIDEIVEEASEDYRMPEEVWNKILQKIKEVKGNG